MRFGDFSLMGQDQALFAANAANTDNQVASGPIVGNQPCILTHKRNPPGLRSSFVFAGDSPDLIDHFPFVL
jgi:hypothetical protein